MNRLNAKNHAANKFNAKKVEVDGFTFASKKEANRYAELKMLLVADKITDLRIHPEYEFEVNGVRVGKYTPDFRYVNERGIVVEDVKSKATKTDEAYGLRKKLMLACHGIEVMEV